MGDKTLSWTWTWPPGPQEMRYLDLMLERMIFIDLERSLEAYSSVLS
jgi:hypothetical protein